MKFEIKEVGDGDGRSARCRHAGIAGGWFRRKMMGRHVWGFGSDLFQLGKRKVERERERERVAKCK
jgi:hypothetical protein